MKHIGTAVVLQNTDEGWQVTSEDVVKTSDSSGVLERVSFTVLLPRRADLTIEEIQVYATKRAIELLRDWLTQRGQ